MKKAIVLALAVMLTLSLAVPAAAVGSPVAPTTSETTTAPLPEIVEQETKTEDGATVTVEPVAADKVEEMPKEEQKTFVAAQEKLAEAAPAGMKTQFFFYAKVTKKAADGTTAKSDAPVSMTVKVDSAAKVVVKQFVDGKWVERKVVVNADGTITIENVEDGPIAIFTV